MENKRKLKAQSLDSESIFERLLALPLFQGLSVEELVRIVEGAKFEFRTESKHEVLLYQGNPLTHLSFMLQGELMYQRRFPDFIKSVEYFAEPIAILPHCLFGKKAQSTHTIITNTDVSLLDISKQEVLTQLMNFYVFRLTMLNYFSTIAQEAQSFNPDEIHLHIRLVKELRKYFVSDSGRKEISINMQQLADRLYVSRISISKVLRSFEEAGLVTLTRGGIVIPRFEELTKAAEKHQ